MAYRNALRARSLPCLKSGRGACAEERPQGGRNNHFIPAGKRLLYLWHSPGWPLSRAARPARPSWVSLVANLDYIICEDKLLRCM